MFPGIYVSGEALERAWAYRFGYRTVCQHPREIGEPDVSETLACDFDNPLFEDHEAVVACVKMAARRGLLVGIHTYYPQTLELYGLTGLPNVLVAKTHRLVLVKLGRYAKLHGRPWQLDVMTVKFLESEVNDVPDNHDEGTVGAEARASARP